MSAKDRHQSKSSKDLEDSCISHKKLQLKLRSRDAAGIIQGQAAIIRRDQTRIQLLIILNSKSALISTFLVLHGATQNIDKSSLNAVLLPEAPLPGNSRERCPEQC